MKKKQKLIILLSFLVIALFISASFYLLYSQSFYNYFYKKYKEHLVKKYNYLGLDRYNINYNAYIPKEKLTKKEVLQDLKQLKEVILKFYPYPYDYSKFKKKVIKKYNESVSIIKNHKSNIFKKEEYINIFYPFMNCIKDTHSFIFININNFNIKFPLVKFFYDFNNDNLYLSYYFDNNENKLKYLDTKLKVVEINGIKIKEFLDGIYDYFNIPIYNSSIALVINEKDLSDLFMYFSFLFPDYDYYSIKVYDEEKNKFLSLKLKCFDIQKIINLISNNIKTINKKNNFLYNNLIRFKPIEILNDEYMKIFYLSKINTLYFKILSFGGNDPKYMYHLANYILELKNIKERFGAGNIIIDIRDNGGGNSSIAEKLLDKIYNLNINFIFNYNIYITKYTNLFQRIKRFNNLITFINFSPIILIDKGYKLDKIKIKSLFKNVYILQNYFDFSSTIFFLNVIKNYNLPSIKIGENTGDFSSTGYYGSFYYLKNSNLLYCLSSKYVKFLSKKSVLPDIEVHQTIDDLLKNKDTILEYTLNLIEKERE